MHNVINEDELRIWIAEQIADQSADVGGHGETLARLARRHAEASEGVRRARKLRASDPDWAWQRRREGVPLYRFWPGDAGVLQADIETAAEQVEELGRLSGRKPRTDSALRATRLLRGLARRSLDQVVHEAAAIIDAAQDEVLKARYRERLCDPTPLRLGGGVLAYRARSLAVVDRIGREADNCLKKSGRHYRGYWQRILDRELDVWELRGKQLFKPSRLRAVISVDLDENAIAEIEGPDGGPAPARYREAVLAFLRRLKLNVGDDDGPLVDLGIVPQLGRRDRPPTIEGTIGRTPYRLWAWRGAVLIEIGASAPRYAYYGLDPETSLEEQEAFDLVRGLDRDEARRPDPLLVQRALADAAARLPKIGPTLSKLLALSLREAVR